MSSRYSNEDAVRQIPNRFELVLIASQRVRELRRGHKPYVDTTTSHGLTALREIEEGFVGADHLKRIGDRVTDSKG